jgi:AcrR family transcriptional regulator
LAKAARQRLDPNRRIELILDATLGLVGTSHFSVVTMRDIALACDVNVALLYHYFSSKDDLVRRVLARALSQITDDYESRRCDHEDDFLADIGAWFSTHASMAPSMMSRMVKLMSDQAALPVRDPELDVLVLGFYQFERDLIIHTLDAGITAGRYRMVDSEKLARFVGLHLDGIFHGAESRGEIRIASDIGDLRELLEAQLRP